MRGGENGCAFGQFLYEDGILTQHFFRGGDETTSCPGDSRNPFSFVAGVTGV